MVGIVLVLTLIFGALRIRKPVGAALLPQIEGEGRPHQLLRTLASLWHVAFIVYILFLYILSTYKRGLGGTRRPIPACSACSSWSWHLARTSSCDPYSTVSSLLKKRKGWVRT